jgi:organic hydroperoxide reductase OsmC/OhrA
MHPFPHTYRVRGIARDEENPELVADGLPRLPTASPPEFGGPGDRWSPETLLVGAIADCFILTFRAIARTASLPWTMLECEVRGTLDRVDRVTQFTHYDLDAWLVVPEGTPVADARAALEKAEHHCLVTRSLKGRVHLQLHIEAQGARTIPPTWASGLPR